VIVDEAHNQGTPLAVDTLVRLNPSCILELTATPDRICQPSNVLRSVSAATLQAEDMLKLPLELAIHPVWRTSLTEAIGRLRQLEKDAEEEREQTGEIIEPVVMLIQAERRDQNRETFTPERVKAHLIDDFQIAPANIAIATGAVDELAGKKLGDPDYPQFIITVDKLREGWDCPFAYVLFSFRNTTSATAVEQVLGRILRMPHVRRKRKETLNRSYAYVVSDQLAATMHGLRDGLVQNGFERLEIKDLIRTGDEGSGNLSLFSLLQKDLTIPLPDIGESIALPDADALAALPVTLRNRIEISPETGTLTIKGEANANQIRQIAEAFRQPDAARLVQERLDIQIAAKATPSEREETPAEKGVSAKVPLLGFRQRSFFDIFDETPLLDADWEIGEFDWKLSESEFSHDMETMRRASLNISQLGQIECDVYDRLDNQLALFGKEPDWQVTDLIGWLDRNIPFPYADAGQKAAWINAAITYLMEKRNLALDELAYRKFRLRGALERKLAAGLALAKQRVFQGLLGDESRFVVRDEHAVVFEQGRYAYDTPYTGFVKLKRHFFPAIGNLKSSGEEFECAEFIANSLTGVEWWVRNVERKPTSFWLQTASDRFYPDFIVKMNSGVILAVEYKGSHIADNADSREKERIGELWAKRSEGRCRFVMVKDKQWNLIEERLQ